MDLRWSPDFPAQQIKLVARVTDAETGEEIVVVRKAGCSRLCYTVAEWERMEPVVVYDRDGSA